MLKIHTTDGQTIRIDLRDPAQAREWLPRLEQDAFQASISGVSVVETHDVRTRCAACGGKGSGQIGVQYSVSRPQGLSGVTYEAERVSNNGRSGDRVTIFAGDVRLSLMAHESQPSARVQLVKSGKRRFAPKRHSE